MPNTVLGKVSLTPRGAYRSGTRYTALDLVGHEGGGYIALREVQDIAPSDDGVNWMLLAARGGEGIQGEQGIPGYVFTPSVSAEGVVSWTNNGDLPNPDPVDIMGPEGPRGPKGDSVVSIEHTGGTGAPGTTDIYTVKLSNGSIAGAFQVYNGADGNGTGDFKADGSVPMTGNLQMGGNRVVGVGSAQESTDAVNKSDLDKAIQSVTVTTDAEPVEGSHNPVQSGGVFSALSNKLSNGLSDRTQIPDGSNLKAFMTGKPFGYYFVSEGDVVEGLPNADPTWWFLWYVPSGIWAFTNNTNKVWRAEFTSNYLYKWREIAFGGPPKEYNLPLADGWQAIIPSLYAKNQFSEVTINARLKFTGNFERGTVFATLPEGYRPNKQVTVFARVVNSQNQSNFGHIDITQDGEMFLYADGAAGAPLNEVFMPSISFIAGS